MRGLTIPSFFKGIEVSLKKMFRKDLREGDCYPDRWLVWGYVWPLTSTCPVVRVYLRIKLPCYRHGRVDEWYHDWVTYRWQQLNLVFRKTRGEPVKWAHDGWTLEWVSLPEPPTAAFTALDIQRFGEHRAPNRADSTHPPA